MEISLPQDQAVPLLGIYLKETYSYHKDTCSIVFIATLFIITRTWKQPRCSSYEWIKKMWYTNTMEYYSVIKKNNDILKLADKWIELEKNPE